MNSRRTLFAGLIASLALIAAPALAQTTYSQGQTGTVGTLSSCTDTSGNSIRCVVPAVGAITTVTTITNPVGIKGEDGATIASETNPVPVGVSVATPTDVAGTVTTGGVAQTAIAANAARKGYCIQNPATAPGALRVREGAAATASTGVSLVPGQQACNAALIVPVGIISVFSATTGHAWNGTEYQ